MGSCFSIPHRWGATKMFVCGELNCNAFDSIAMVVQFVARNRSHTHTQPHSATDEDPSTCNSRHLALFLTSPWNVVPWTATLTLKRHLVFTWLASLGYSVCLMYSYACACRCYHSMPRFMPVKCHLCQMAFGESSEIWFSSALRKISI